MPRWSALAKQTNVRPIRAVRFVMFGGLGDDWILSFVESFFSKSSQRNDELNCTSQPSGNKAHALFTCVRLAVQLRLCRAGFLVIKDVFYLMAMHVSGEHVFVMTGGTDSDAKLTAPARDMAGVEYPVSIRRRPQQFAGVVDRLAKRARRHMAIGRLIRKPIYRYRAVDKTGTAASNAHCLRFYIAP
ncbi:hypothetical protein J1614_001992 [Plenodomus biglobosus]|nr:hypothetical protein J1614_001992 [Plenodomus biglobosus]